jgi:polar amino acid transport system substrate-binding protein
MQMIKRLTFAGFALSLAILSPCCAALTIETVTEDASYSFLESGRVAGVASEIAEKMLTLAGLPDYRMALYPWARAYDMARLRANVLIYPIMRTKARETQFKWVGELTRITPRLYKLRNEEGLQISSLDDARQHVIGVVREDVRHRYFEDHGFDRMVVSASHAENFRKLLHHQVQLIAMPEREARQLCDQAQIAFVDLESVYSLTDLSSGLYYAYSLSTADEVVERSREAFAKLKASGLLEEVARGDQPLRPRSAQ